ncbi:carbohydrate ABC transporter permease [Micromonospora sp. M12]
MPSYFAYYTFFKKLQVGYGSAISTVLTLIIVIVAVVFIAMQARSERRDRGSEMAVITPTAAPVTPAGPYPTGTTAASAAGSCSPWSSSARSSCWCRSRSCCSTRSSRRGLLVGWPAELADGVLHQGSADVLDRCELPAQLWNSALIAGSVAVLGVAVSLLNAYALGIGRVRGRLWIVGLFLLANMLPQEALIYPLYYVAKEVGLYNTRLAVIIIFTVIQSAFGTYLLASVMGTFPRSLLEAAALDGAGKWTVLWRVVFPNLRPTLAVLLIFFFIWTWNEFLIPLVMLIDNQTQTIPVALASLQGDRLMDARPRTPAR